MASTELRRRIPHGVQDLFGLPAARRARLEEILARNHEAWGYQRIVPPTFEHYETLALEAGRLAEEMYRFLDRDGQVLALRPDMTIPTARIVGTKLADRPLPLRLYYSGSVFRYEEPQAGRQREFTQAGVELIGAAGPLADAEVVALAVEGLRQAGLEAFSITLSHTGYVRGVVAELGLDAEAEEEARRAIHLKDRHLIGQILGRSRNGAAARALELLPDLAGGPEVLEVARASAPNPEARGAAAELLATWQALEPYGVQPWLTIDVGEAQGMDYYTGISFEGFARGLGYPLLSGGRYDQMVGHFGRPLPAVGYAIGLERALLALGEAVDVAAGPDLLTCGHAHAQPVARRERAAGRRVEVDVLGREDEELRAYALQRGIAHLWLCGREETP